MAKCSTKSRVSGRGLQRWAMRQSFVMMAEQLLDIDHLNEADAEVLERIRVEDPLSIVSQTIVREIWDEHFEGIPRVRNG